MLLLSKWSATLCLGLLLFSSACRKDRTGKPDEPIVFGAIYNLSGDQSALDIPASKGAQLAVDLINANGGINGREVQLILKDGKSDQDTLASSVAEVLTDHPNTLAFLGLSDSDKVVAAAGGATDSGRVFLTSGATSTGLPAQFPGYLFLACFGDNVQAAAAAEWAYDKLNARTVSVVYDSTEIYTRQLRTYFVSRFEALGGQVLSTQAYAEGHVETAVEHIAPADFIFFSALPPDAPVGVQLMRQAGIKLPIVGGDGYDEPAVWQSYPDTRDVYFTTHVYLGADNPDPRVQTFRQAYMEAFQEEPTAFSALGYDAVQLLVEAARKAGTSSSEALAGALQNMEDFPGVTGLISYGPGIYIPRKSVSIMQVNSGNQQLVTQLVPEKVPAP